MDTIGTVAGRSRLAAAMSRIQVVQPRIALTRWFSLLLVAALTACSERQPSSVVVPDHSFSQSVVATTDQGDTARVQVNNSVRLVATRTSGPWVWVERSTLPPDACWLRRPPPDPEVADNLTWIVDPPGTATFNLGIRSDHSRGVRFSEPGVYRLAGESSGWCGQTVLSNQLTVEVVE